MSGITVIAIFDMVIGKPILSPIIDIFSELRTDSYQYGYGNVHSGSGRVLINEFRDYNFYFNALREEDVDVDKVIFSSFARPFLVSFEASDVKLINMALKSISDPKVLVDNDHFSLMWIDEVKELIDVDPAWHRLSGRYPK